MVPRAGRAMRRTSRAGSADAGFTLLELLLVLAIMGLLIAVAAPRFQAASTPSLATRAALLASSFRVARQRAVLSGRPERVAIAAPLDSDEAEGEAPPSDASAELVFFPDGSSTGGRILLEEERRLIALEVDPLTGAVRVAEP
jgi:general secretion pathway protein H